MKKMIAFDSFGRKCKNSFICFWFSWPGDVAFLFVLVRIVLTGPLEIDFKTSNTQISEGDFIFSHN